MADGCQVVNMCRGTYDEGQPDQMYAGAKLLMERTAPVSVDCR